MVGAIRGGTGASPRLGRTRDTVSWGGGPDLSASTEGRVLRVVPGGNESGEGRTEVQRASTVRCAMLYRVDREGELRSSGGSRTSQKRQSNTTGKLDSHRVASSRSTPRSTDTLHRTPPHHWRGSTGTVRAVQRPTRSANLSSKHLSFPHSPRTDFRSRSRSRGPRTDFSINPNQRLMASLISGHQWLRGPRTDFSITPQHRARCVSHTLWRSCR